MKIYGFTRMAGCEYVNGPALGTSTNACAIHPVDSSLCAHRIQPPRKLIPFISLVFLGPRYAKGIYFFFLEC